MSDGQLQSDIAALRELYKPTEVPPCRVCEAQLSIQAVGGGEPTRYACIAKLADGRTDWDHYDRSRWEDRRQGGDERVMRLIDHVERLQDEVQRLSGELGALRSALNHISATASASRTSTRRLRWIEQRAQWALDGKPYDDSAFDLPKYAGDSVESLKSEVQRLTEERDALLRTALGRRAAAARPGGEQ